MRALRAVYSPAKDAGDPHGALRSLDSRKNGARSFGTTGQGQLWPGKGSLLGGASLRLKSACAQHDAGLHFVASGGRVRPIRMLRSLGARKNGARSG